MGILRSASVAIKLSSMVRMLINFRSILTGHSDYSRRIDLVKRGFSGYNTVNALSILPRIFPGPEQGRVRLLVG